MLVSEERKAPRPRRRSRLGPVGWFIVLMIGGYAVLAGLFYWQLSVSGLGSAIFFIAFLVYDFVVYLIYFWIAVYLVVELQLWRRTRNQGHLLQFLGALLVLAPISWGLITFVSMNLYGMFSLAGIALVVMEFVSLVAGFVMALYGYYHRGFHASDVDLYRNVVVRAGEKIGLLTDGYSTRVYETRYEGFPGDAVRRRADEYATRFQRAGFFLFHRTDTTGIVLYPITYTGVGGLRLVTAFAHLYRLWRKPDRLTWVRVDRTGDVRVHISPEDYARIKRPVAHHVLCAGVADAVVGSLLAYVNGQEAAAVRTLLGPEPVRRPDDLRLPPTKPSLGGWAAIGLAITIIVAGAGAAIFVDFVSVSQPGLSIHDVYWRPANPVGGQPIYLYANLTGQGSPFGPMDQSFGVTIWAYYNDSVFGARFFANIEGNHYGVWLGTYPNGTEVTFILQASQMAGSGYVYATSLPYVLDIGPVQRGGPSGLSIQAPSLQIGPTGAGTFGAWINSTLPINTAQVLISGYYTYSNSQGSGSGGIGIAAINLTASGGYYTLTIPSGALGPLTSEHVQAVIWYKFVARDTSWNTATTALLTHEVSR